MGVKNSSMSFVVLPMQPAASSPDVDEHSARELAHLLQDRQRYCPQCGQNLRSPFVTPRVWELCVNILLGVNYTGVHFFQAVGFLSEVFDLVDSDVSALQQANCLLAANITVWVGTLWFGIVLVLKQNISVAFHTGDLAASVRANRGDSEFFSRVLIDPIVGEPLSGVSLMRRNEMKAVRFDSAGWPSGLTWHANKKLKDLIRSG
jgi:hypothetical protein